MKYFSTRGNSVKDGAAYAIAEGLAPDGGLYVPESVPRVGADNIERMCGMDYRARAEYVMGLYLEDFTAEEVCKVCAAAYGDNYDDARIAPLSVQGNGISFLELWHGPTAAFKDMALQALPHLLTLSLKKTGESRTVLILVATSGDTGKAALEGFADTEGTKILVFYPDDGVSDVQKLQMVTQVGENVSVCAVKGNFDDAQSGVKLLFADKELAKSLDEQGIFLSSANSINWGRLLPQIVYYFSAYCDLVSAGRVKIGEEINFSVPTGNFGNILAGYMAKRMGLPVKKFICASNANNVLTDFINTGVYDRTRPFYKTASPSMDILISSNLERLLYFVSGSSDEVSTYMKKLGTEGRYEVGSALKTDIEREFFASYCSDDDTFERINGLYEREGYLMDTHTAVGYKAVEDYRAATGDETETVIVSTASPYKFCDSVLRALGDNAEGNGAELVDGLERRTGTQAPKPLKDLDKRAIRFTDSVETGEMRKYLLSTVM